MLLQQELLGGGRLLGHILCGRTNTTSFFAGATAVSASFLLAAAHPQSERGAIYNVGSGVETTLREIVELAPSRLDIAAEPAWGSMGDRHWDTEVWVADAEKITRELGWRPRYTLAEGFDRTVKWFIDHADQLPNST